LYKCTAATNRIAQTFLVRSSGRWRNLELFDYTAITLQTTDGRTTLLHCYSA